MLSVLPKHQHILNDLAFIHKGLICFSPNPFRVTAAGNNKQFSVFFCLTRDIPAKPKDREAFSPACRSHWPVSSPAKGGVPHLSARFWGPMTVPSIQIKNACFLFVPDLRCLENASLLHWNRNSDRFLSVRAVKMNTLTWNIEATRSSGRVFMSHCCLSFHSYDNVEGKLELSGTWLNCD